MAEHDCIKQDTLWDVPPEKRCPKCKRWKPLDAFGKLNGKRRSHCRDCHNSYIQVVDATTEKICPRCKLLKKSDEFGTINKRIRPYCKPCCSELSRNRYLALRAAGISQELNRADYQKRRRWEKLLAWYGITKEQYEEKLVAQENACEICRKPETEMWRGLVLNLSVDHDHSNGKVRGLVCRRCNIGIANFRDDVSVLKSAIAYLEKYKED